jgi:hypothetical protein
MSFVLIITAGVLWTLGKQTSFKLALRATAVTFLGLMVVAGPWILLLSLKYEKPVFSTSGPINHTLVGPGPIDLSHAVVFKTFHVPEPGRITSWEDPTAMPYRTWSPLESRQAAVHQLKVMHANAIRIFQHLRSFDWLGIGPVAVLFGLLFHAPWRENLRSDRWRWSAILIVCLTGFYLPVYALEQRYYLVTYPFLLGGSFGFVISMTQSLSSNARIFRWIAISLVTLSFAMSIEGPFRWAFQPLTNDVRIASYEVARIFSAKLKASNIFGPVAVASREPSARVGLYSAFFMDVPYHGNQPETQTVEEVESSLAKIIVVDRGSLLDSKLNQNKNFISLDNVLFDSVSEALSSSVKVYLNTSK